MTLRQLLKISTEITQVIIDFDGRDNLFTTENGKLEDWLYYGWDNYEEPKKLMKQLLKRNVVSIDIWNEHELFIKLENNSK